MDDDRPFLTEAFFRFMDLSDEIDEAFANFWYALFRPFRVEKMTNRS
jgi:hypothetical protein